MNSQYLNLLKNRVNLRTIPFTDRGSRLLLVRSDEHFQVRLAERWFEATGQSAGIGLRPLLLDRLQITDETGTPLPMEVTTYPHRVDCETSVGTVTLTFASENALLVALPAGTVGVTFQPSLQSPSTDARGGVLQRTGAFARTFAYTTDAKVLNNEISRVGEEVQRVHLIVESDGTEAVLLAYSYQDDVRREVPAALDALERATRRWHAWFDAAPTIAETAPWYEQYYYAWWILRAGTLSPRRYLTRETLTPSKVRYVGAWQWDNYFHTVAYRHVDTELAKDQIRLLLDHQRDDGMLPDAIHENEIVTRLPFPVDAEVTKPPLLGWAAWKIFAVDGDREFLREIYAPLVRLTEWWLTQRAAEDGLCAYGHPYSSGLDDNPLWDAGMPVTSPDLNTYLYLQLETLSHVAEVLGHEDDARTWSVRATQVLQGMFRALWDAEAGRFWALHDGERVDVHTPFNYFPLMTGKLPVQMLNPIVGHLTDADQFWASCPLTTVARNDPTYEPDTMWRGPIWINVNYLIYEGLKRCGYRELARELRRRTLELVAGSYDVYEYYNPETGEGPSTAAPTFGWSAALFVDLALQAASDDEV